MQHRSNDRETFCESSRTPAPPGAGDFPFGSDLLLRTLVHDTANWLQRLHGPLGRLEGRLAGDDPALADLRAGLARCAELGEEALRALTNTPTPTRTSLTEALDAFRREDARVVGPASLRLEGVLPENAFVPLSAGALQNLLLNLVTNARESSPAQRPVSLAAHVHGDELELRVRDQGRGMDSETLERCLEPGRTSHDDPARGMGLPSVWATLRRVGGKLTFESTPGQGTTAIVTLPRVDGTKSASPGDPAVKARMRTVLLVEDDAAVREVLVEMLRASGHRVHAVDTARAAWTELESRSFEAVILDQGLPDVPGQDVAEGIRQENPDLVLVLLTGDARAVQEGQRPPALDAVGLKPLGLEELHSLLEDAFVQARRRRSANERARPARG